MPALAVAALAVIPFRAGPTLCPFALMTGVACPGCGLTRAASALVRGDLVAALGLHPLVPLAVAWLAGVWVVGYLRRSGRTITFAPGLVGRLLNLTGVALIVTWLVRLATGTLPPV